MTTQGSQRDRGVVGRGAFGRFGRPGGSGGRHWSSGLGLINTPGGGPLHGTARETNHPFRWQRRAGARRSRGSPGSGTACRTFRLMAGMPRDAVGTPVRWSIPDALLCYLAGLVAAIVTTTIAAGLSGQTNSSGTNETAGVLAAAFVGQYGGTVLALLWVSRRKGRGSLVDDFGLRIHAADWWVLPAGALLEVGLAIALVPLSHIGKGDTQEVVNELHSANGAKLAVLAVGAGLMAPIVEELLFRGLLLRALLRRVPATPAVAISGVSFALLHLVDPSIGTV